MPDFASSQGRALAVYADFLSGVRALAIPHLVFQDLPLRSVAEYSITDQGEDFPRPSEHFIISDYLIDLPVITIDLGAASPTHGRILGYCNREHWLIADSLAEFADRLKSIGDSAVYGKE